MKKKSLILLLILLAITLILVSCTEEDGTDTDTSSNGDPAKTYTLSGTLTLESPNPSGRTAYLKLVAQGGSSTDTSLYGTSASFTSKGVAITSTTYSIQEVAEGTYTGYAFIDMVSDANPSNPAPGSGDYATMSGADITISSDTTLDLSNGAWTAY